MKKHWISWCLATACVIAPLSAADEEETKLGKQMEEMNDAFKALRRETDPAKGAAHARTMQDAALKSAVEIPVTVTKLPDGPEKAKAIASYRKMIGGLFVTLCEVEEAFLNGKADGVPKLIDSIKNEKKEGHDQFVEDEEEEKH